MLLSKYDFYDIYAVLLRLRFYTDEPCTKEIVEKISALIDTPQKGNIVAPNLVRRTLSEIPALDREVWRWVFVNNVYTYGECIIKDVLCYEILSAAFAELSLCVQQTNHQEQLFDLTDALHNVAILLADGCKNMKKAIRIEISIYRKKWNPDFLRKELGR